MDTITSPSFAAEVAFTALGIFLLSLIPVFMAGSVINRLRLQGKLRAANTGEGLTDSDKWLFWFQKKCGEGYYPLFLQLLCFSVLLGTGPWICRDTEEQYRGFHVGQPSHERLVVFQMIYDGFGPQGVVLFTKALYIVMAIIAVVVVTGAIRKIIKKQPFESDTF
jgi:hypothetical protein